MGGSACGGGEEEMGVGIENKVKKFKKLKWEEILWTDNDKVEWIKKNNVLNCKI